MKYYMEKYLRDKKRVIPPVKSEIEIVGEYPGDERTFTPEELEAIVPEEVLRYTSTRINKKDKKDEKIYRAKDLHISLQSRVINFMCWDPDKPVWQIIKELKELPFVPTSNLLIIDLHAWLDHKK